MKIVQLFICILYYYYKNRSENHQEIYVHTTDDYLFVYFISINIYL